MNWLQKVAFSAEDFDNLACAQRGAPEAAMLRMQQAQISQLYDWVAEHVGDLTHRMSEKIEYFRGQFGIVQEKVRKTLRSLTNAYGFEREVEEQIQSNLRYNGIEVNRQTFSEALERLKALGRDYANAHKQLPVFNTVQEYARNAAIALGEFRFNEAIANLESLEQILEQGPQAWEQKATEGLDR